MVEPLGECRDVSLYGGKAVNLGVLLRAGLPVPDGLAVSIDAFVSDGALRAEAKQRIIGVLDANLRYAVRSSATVEDAAEASWAGQFESYLDVAAGDVPKQIEICHAAIKARATAYGAEQASQPELAAQVAVVVQPMVQARYAGVLFTKNPSNGANQITVEYISGLAEALVHGDADPERFVWSRGRRTLKQQTETTIPFDHAQLAALGEQVETAFDAVPQDIEWAYDGDTFWLVQARPITTLQERAAASITSVILMICFIGDHRGRAALYGRFFKY